MRERGGCDGGVEAKAAIGSGCSSEGEEVGASKQQARRDEGQANHHFAFGLGRESNSSGGPNQCDAIPDARGDPDPPNPTQPPTPGQTLRSTNATWTCTHTPDWWCYHEMRFVPLGMREIS
uniref:Uncharacterized protein n=1 Tax=Oryza sativa subsp. japonica TaxID=39947 RepID=Q6YUR5_ORYSJ|nr:hypothetical protein [Oryza sativa Japonica Group]BAD08142.1 hypothetical protein [Oryza sativa Japonica Group]